jgi:uncharacterized protein (TIGR02001 family)
MQITKISLAASILCLASSAAFAQAKAPEPDYTLSYNVGATTDYRFRGISQTSKNPAIQGGIDFAHKNGLYLGAWASNVSWVKDFNGASKGSLELDLYGGYKGEIAKDFTYDLGVISYQYPGNDSGAAGTLGAGSVSNANTNELYGAITYGLYTAKYSRSLGNFLGFIDSSGSSYLDLSAAIDLGNGFSLTPHVGRQLVANSSAYNYTDYALSLSKDMGKGLTLSIAATGTNANKLAYTDTKGKVISNNALAIGAKYSF